MVEDYLVKYEWNEKAGCERVQSSCTQREHATPVGKSELLAAGKAGKAGKVYL